MTRHVLAALLLLPLLAGVAEALTGAELDERRAEVGALIDSRSYEAAESAARGLLAEIETARGPDALEAGQVIDLLVDARLGQRAADEECLALARRAVRIKEQAAGPDEPETAESLRRLALVLQARQQATEARAPMERALAIQETRFGKGSPQAADVLARLAYLYRDLGLERRAAALLEETLAIREGDPDAEPRSLAPLLYNLAVMKTALGEFEDAEAHYRRLLDVTPESAGRERSVAWNGLGMVFIEEARYVEAQDAMERAIAAAKEGNAAPEMMAYYLNNMAFLLKQIGDYDDAIPLYEQTLEIRRRTDGNEHVNTAATLANLAEVHFLNGDLDVAQSLHEEALAIHERVSDEATVATSLQKLATVYLARGRTDDALALLRRALDIRTRHLGAEHYDTGKVRSLLAGALLAAGDPAGAETEYRHALATLRATLGPDHPECVVARLGLARSLAARGTFAEAWTVALEAEEYAREHTELTAAALPERLALRYAAVTKESQDLLLSLVDRVPDPDAAATCWDRVIRSRALVLDLMGARRAGLDADSDPAAKRLAEEYETASRNLASLILGTADTDGGNPEERIREARNERERIERELAARSARFSRSLARRGIGLQEVAAARPPDATLVGYVRHAVTDFATGAPGADRYGAFVLRAGSDSPDWVPLGPAAPIDDAVVAWRTEVETGGRDSDALERCRQRGDRLRAVAWDPLFGDRPAQGTVFLVPDGDLHRVSFYALPRGPSSYLVEDDLLIQYLSAERDVVPPAEAAPEGRGFLAVGGVDFGPVRETRSSGPLGGVGFRPLPATVDEVRSLAALWQRTSGDDLAPVVLTGTDAAEGPVKADIPGHRIVHLATHGFFLDGSAGDGLRGTRSISGISPKAPVSRESALSLSGLALAGANLRGEDASSGEDGVLTAQEIASLDLTGTDWVVLSACDTGLGELQSGEGVLGLRRAFEVAGAGTLVMSLWEVDDAATRRWMETLYGSRFEKKESTMASVRDACRAVLAWSREQESTDHPFYWGAFVAVGRWR